MKQIHDFVAAASEMIAAYGNCGSPRQQQAADALAACIKAASITPSPDADLLSYARNEPEQVKWRSEFEGHIQSARDNFADDDLEIDDTPLISPGVDGSVVWVNAWVWVASDQDGE